MTETLFLSALAMWENALWKNMDLTPTIELFWKILEKLTVEEPNNTDLIAVTAACMRLAEADRFLRDHDGDSAVIKHALSESGVTLTGVGMSFTFIDVENVRLAIQDRLEALG